MEAGDQVPVIPFKEVAGKSGTLPPAHIVREVPKPKVGVTLELTVTFKEVLTAH